MQFFGYSLNSDVERVANLTDNQTLTQLRCVRCPAGIIWYECGRCRSHCRIAAHSASRFLPGDLCVFGGGVGSDQEGREFHTLEFQAKYWASYKHLSGQPKLLAETNSVEQCRVVQGATCLGGSWNETAACALGYKGPLCGQFVL